MQELQCGEYGELQQPQLHVVQEEGLRDAGGLPTIVGSIAMPDVAAEPDQAQLPHHDAVDELAMAGMSVMTAFDHSNVFDHSHAAEPEVGVFEAEQPQGRAAAGSSHGQWVWQAGGEVGVEGGLAAARGGGGDRLHPRLQGPAAALLEGGQEQERGGGVDGDQQKQRWVMRSKDGAEVVGEGFEGSSAALQKQELRQDLGVRVGRRGRSRPASPAARENKSRARSPPSVASSVEKASKSGAWVP